MADKNFVSTDVVKCYDGVFKGMHDEKLSKLYQAGRTLIVAGKWNEGKNTFIRALEMSENKPLDRKTLKIVITEMERVEKYAIQKDTQPAVVVDWKAVVKRDLERLDESLFGTPQSIFFLNLGIPGHPEYVCLVGRKLLSDWWVNMKIPDIHCSYVTPSMILGLFVDQRIGDSRITLHYHPLDNPEKIKIMNGIKENDGKNIELIFPFPLLQESSRQERSTPPEGWMVDEGFEAILGCGEERIRHYSIQFLKNIGLVNHLLFDPACSTGEFLSSMQKALPGCYTIGQDLSQQMAKLASKRIDEAYCANASTPKIKPGTADVVFVRFLNSEVVRTSEAETLLHALLPAVKSGGYLIIFGHTPVLLSSSNLRRLKDFQLQRCVGIHENGEGMFQYYVLTN